MDVCVAFCGVETACVVELSCFEDDVPVELEAA